MSNSNVTLEIAGRSHSLACAAEEVAHIESLGRMINARLTAQGGMAGQSPERTLLYAALLLADELQETGGGAVSAQADTSGNAEKLENLADRLEALASELESA